MHSGSKSAAKSQENKYKTQSVEPLMLSEQNTVLKNANKIFETMKTRRTCRHFSDDEIDLEVLKTCILTAGTAPSGANKQPWFFSVVINKELKKAIREAAEIEEYKLYHEKAGEDFINDIRPFKTNWQKPHLEEASALIVIFAKTFEMVDGKKSNCYYVKESVGIATGFLISMLHQLGYACLTHTPNPMFFLNKLLNRSLSDKPFLILAVGNRKDGSEIIGVEKKNLSQILDVRI